MELQSYTFSPLKNYKIYLQITNTETEVISSDSIEFEVQKSDLVVRIYGGESILSSDSEISLFAKVFDPDTPGEEVEID